VLRLHVLADRTTIEWTDATWNPLRGCTRVSEGCRNCYAEVMAARFSDPGQWGQGLAQRIALPGGAIDHRWTGKVAMVENQLDQPVRWKRSRRIFVNSTSDLFHDAVPDEWIDRVFAVMALSPHHTFQVLTKRPERMLAYMQGLGELGPSEFLNRAGGRLRQGAEYATRNSARTRFDYPQRWPLANVWLCTSVEDQTTADRRIPQLLAVPAVVRFLSVEPMLGPVDLSPWMGVHHSRDNNLSDRETRGAITKMIQLARDQFRAEHRNHGLDWVICGGESGPGARVWEGFEDAARSLRDQCCSAGVAFFMKQMAGPRKASMPPIPADLMVREFPGVTHA
jgi:protein gp37